MLQVSLDILNQLTKPQCVKPKHDPFTIARYYNLLNVKVQWLCNKSPISSFMTAYFCALGSPWTSSSVDRSGKIFFLASSGLYIYILVNLCSDHDLQKISLHLSCQRNLFAKSEICCLCRLQRLWKSWKWKKCKTMIIQFHIYKFYVLVRKTSGNRNTNVQLSIKPVHDVHHFLSWKSDRIKITVNHPVGRHRWKATPRKFHHGSSAKWGALHGCLQLLSIWHV